MANKDGGTLVYADDSRTGELRHVSEVPNGKACGCVCPGCGWELIAVHPNSGRIKHFRHAPDHEGNERQCHNIAGASESIIHRYVKRTLAQMDSLYLPAYSLGQKYQGYRFHKKALFESIEWKLSNPKEEDRSLSSLFTPDITFDFPRGKLAIEICYTNSVSKEKLSSMLAAGLHVLEIHVGHLSPDMLGLEPIRRIAYEDRYSKWLHVPLTEKENLEVTQWVDEQKRLIDLRLKREEELEKQKQQAELARQQQELEIQLAEERERQEEDTAFFISCIEGAITDHLYTLLQRREASCFNVEERGAIISEIHKVSQNLHEQLLSSTGEFNDSDEQLKRLRKLMYEEVSKRITEFRQKAAKRLSLLYMHINFTDAYANELAIRYIDRNYSRTSYHNRQWVGYFSEEIEPYLNDFLTKNSADAGIQKMEDIE